jgi:hypothetical protein
MEVYSTPSGISSAVELSENIQPDILTNTKINAMESACRRLAIVIGGGFDIVTYVLKSIYFSVMI